MIKLPKHINLSIEHNPQAINYETVEQYTARSEDHQKDELDFVSPESKLKAIATNELWGCHWYPDTPVGFCSIYAATLEELLEFLESEEKKS